MRTATVAAMAMVLAWAGPAWTDMAQKERVAVKETLGALRASLEQARGTDAGLGGVKRVAVAPIDSPVPDVTDLVQMAVKNAGFDVVLTSDMDQGAMIEEFARQMEFNEIVKPETLNELLLQGVDAVVWGKVARSQEEVDDGYQKGQRSYLNMTLKMGSLMKDNPTSLLWMGDESVQIEEIETAAQADWLDNYVQRNWPMLAGAGVVLLAVLLFLAYKKAIRPV